MKKRLRAARMWFSCLRAENKRIEFEPILTRQIGYNAKEWCGSDTNRAALAVLLMMDFGLAFAERFSFDFFNAVFLGRSGNNLLLGFYNAEACLTIHYHAVTQNAAYSRLETAMGGGYLENHFKRNSLWYCKIDANGIIDCFITLNEANKN